ALADCGRNDMRQSGTAACCYPVALHGDRGEIGMAQPNDHSRHAGVSDQKVGSPSEQPYRHFRFVAAADQRDQLLDGSWFREILGNSTNPQPAKGSQWFAIADKMLKTCDQIHTAIFQKSERQATTHDCGRTRPDYGSCFLEEFDQNR